ncbi:MAG TPA: TraB/GumN family protein [Kofleriaceae bacterium]|nr:TraB/GumN family protein [Kofleriaceae bacterium]
MRLVVLLLALAACAAKQECKLDPIPPGAHGGAFLWKVQRGGDVVWLYGTIHDSGLDAVPRVALKALEGSVRFVSELGDSEPDREVFIKYARVDHGPGIDTRLPPGDWYDLRDALLGSIKENDLRRAAPWYAMTLLSTKMAPTKEQSMDVLLGKRARELAMPVEPLETWDEQLSALQTAVDIEDLKDAIHARHTMTCDFSRMRASYEAGDTKMMEALLVVPKTQATMLDARNARWLPKIEGYVARGGAFVAVGLGHLLGPKGLPALLEKDGYTVERIGIE